MFEVAHAAGTGSTLIAEAVGVFWFSLIVVVLIFLLTRAVMLWYWKIDRIVSLLEKIEENTRPAVFSVSGSNAVTTKDVAGCESKRRKGLKDILTTKIF
jgi:hypothetical protein